MTLHAALLVGAGLALAAATAAFAWAGTGPAGSASVTVLAASLPTAVLLLAGAALLSRPRRGPHPRLRAATALGWAWVAGLLVAFAAAATLVGGRPRGPGWATVAGIAVAAALSLHAAQALARPQGPLLPAARWARLAGMAAAGGAGLSLLLAASGRLLGASGLLEAGLVAGAVAGGAMAVSWTASLRTPVRQAPWAVVACLACAAASLLVLVLAEVPPGAWHLVPALPVVAAAALLAPRRRPLST